MPDAQKIKKTILQKGIPDEVIAQFAFPKAAGNQPEEAIALINQMDKLLSKAQRLSIMEEQGCCKTGPGAEAHREFGRKQAGKTIQERIALFGELDTNHKAPCRLNDNGTLSVFWGKVENGKYKCLCRAISRLQKNNSKPVNVSPTFCGCCGGHIRHNYQNSLGVKLRLKDIVSSPISSNGEKHCELLYEIVD